MGLWTKSEGFNLEKDQEKYKLFYKDFASSNVLRMFENEQTHHLCAYCVHIIQMKCCSLWMTSVCCVHVT